MMDIQAFSGKNIVVIGDVMLDRYLIGDVTRISPEAPVPVLNYTSENIRLGGAANVALNIAALDANPFVLAIIGNDLEASQMTALFDQHQLSKDGLLSSSSRRTTIKIRLMAGSHQLLRVDKEDTFDINSEEEKQLLSLLEARLQQTKIDAIIFQDYNKGLLTENLITSAIQLAQQFGVKTLVDPKFKNFYAYQGVTLFKPNLKESRENLKVAIDPTSIDSLNNASLLLKEKLQHQHTLITLSEHGIYYDEDQGQSGTIPTHPRNIADVCGAGDTVISVAALALASDYSLKDIAAIANLAGGQVCESPGVVTVDKAQLQKEVLQRLK